VPDSRWNNSDLNQLRNVLGANFEAVDESSLMIDPNLGKARQPAATVGVSVSPASASVPVSGTRQLTAIVTGTANTAVSWLVNGIAGGNGTLGTVSSTGLYAAPAGLPSPATVNVQARSVADPTKTGSASITVTAAGAPVTVTVSPASAAVKLRQTQQFDATVQNTADQAVVWKVNGIPGGNWFVGTISSTGVYKAPSTILSPARVTVSATSVAAPDAGGSATVTLNKRR
jgi:hypothetical protein